MREALTSGGDDVVPRATGSGVSCVAGEGGGLGDVNDTNGGTKDDDDDGDGDAECAECGVKCWMDPEA